MDAMVGELRVAFSSHADQGKAFAMSTYMKGHFPFHGLQKPLRSELQQSFLSQAKALPIEKCHLLVQELWAQPEREYHYVAMDLLLAVKKKWNEETFCLAEKLIVTKSWWDTVDLLAARVIGHFSVKYPAEYRERIISYSLSENIWLNRTSLISQLFAKEKTDTSMFESAFLNCHHKKDFFIQKAIGWALRQYAATDPAWVIRFVNEKALKGLAKREAIRKLSA
jgi:3-methyladenine DNA glycosylase AlkD